MNSLKHGRRTATALIATVLAAGAGFAYAQGSTGPIRIGAYNALTGPIPLTGKQMMTGWQAAVAAINDAGGVHGRKLELIVEDDGYEPSRAVAAARKLVERDQVLLVTGLGTPTTVVVAKYLEQHKVPLLFPMGASSTELNQAGLTQLFMAHPAYSTQAELVVGWMMDNRGSKKPCIIYQVGSSGEDSLLGSKKAAQARGIQLAAAESFERGASNFSAQVLKMKTAGCDMVFTATTLEGTALVVTASERVDFKPQFSGYTTQADSTLIKLLGPLSENFFAADIMVRPDDDVPAMRAYLANLKKFSPEAEPTFFVTYAYAAMMLIADAIRDAGPNPSRDKVVAAMEKGWAQKVSPLMGPVSIHGANHDGKRSLYIVQVKGGKWVKASDWLSVK